MNPRVDALWQTGLGAVRDVVQGNALRPLTVVPPALRRRLAGPPVVIDGNTLDPDLRLLFRLQSLLPGGSPTSVEAVRSALLTSCRLAAGHPVEVRRVTDLTVRGADGHLGARLYVPRTAGRGLLVYFHGGGWVAGDLNTHDAYCRDLAVQAECRILSVDYRRPPEAPAPTAAEDAVAAFAWATEHAEDLGADPALVAVGGDSAGGNLAAVVAQQCVRRGLPSPVLQLLVYPAVDLIGRRPSRDLFADGFVLTETEILWFRDHYTPDPEIRSDPRVSPLFGDPTGTAPAYVVTAGFDPLRDEGAEYVDLLTRSGVPTTHQFEPALTHGFIQILALGGATRSAQLRLADHLKTVLNP